MDGWKISFHLGGSFLASATLLSGSVALAKIQGPKRKGSSSFQPSFFRGELFIFFADVVIHLEPGSDTSSTAQGGGGSFKNRKRIGEIDCCE